MCYGLMLHVTFIKFMTSNNHVDIYDDTKYAKAPNIKWRSMT